MKYQEMGLAVCQHDRAGHRLHTAHTQLPLAATTHSRLQQFSLVTLAVRTLRFVRGGCIALQSKSRNPPLTVGAMSYLIRCVLLSLDHSLRVWILVGLGLAAIGGPRLKLPTVVFFVQPGSV